MEILFSNNYGYFQPGPRFLDINSVDFQDGSETIDIKDLERDRLITRVADAAIGNTSIKAKHDYHKIDGNTQHFDGGVDITVINNLVLTFGSGGAFYVFLKIIKPIVIEWIKYKSNKKIRIKMGDNEIEVSGTTDVDKAIKALEKIKKTEISLKKEKKKK